MSEYSKPILDDLLISFTEDEEIGQANSRLLRFKLTNRICSCGAYVDIVAIAGYLSLKHRGRIEKDE